MDKRSFYLLGLKNWLQVHCGEIIINSSTVNMKCIHRGTTINGVMAISLQLAKESTVPHVMGDKLDEEVQVRQWLEYALWISKISNNKASCRNLLKELNEVLSTRTYMVGNKRTLADVALYLVLHSFMAEMTYTEKEELMHLGRWFDFIQTDELVRHSNSVVFLGRPLI